MTNPRKKRKVTIYLDPEVEKSLAGFAARRDQSQSMIAEAAIASFLSPDAAERREAVIAKRLDQLDRRMQCRWVELDRGGGRKNELTAVGIELAVRESKGIAGKYVSAAAID